MTDSLSPTVMWRQRYTKSLMNAFGEPFTTFTSGHGCTLIDADGNKYLDLLAGIGVNILGHCHPALVTAICEQASLLGHVSNFFATPPQVSLAEKLLQIVTPGGAPDGSRVFFANSGTEANECALKMVRAHANTVAVAHGKTPATRILALEHCFHGRSTGALALTWKEKYRVPFSPLIEGVEFIPVNDITTLRNAVDEDVAAVFVEPIQGESGVHPIDADFLREARRLTSAHGALLVADEVQCGLGRSGEWMAHHAAGIIPDIVTLAKGLGGGMPIGACIGLAEQGSEFTPGMHGTTFGGNPICAHVAGTVLDILTKEDLIAHSHTLGEQWREDLRAADIPQITDIRGRGLFIGIDFATPIAPTLVGIARRHGFIINSTSESTLRVIPPLIITHEETATFTEALPDLVQESLGEFSQETR